MKKLKKLINLWLPVVVWCSLIFFLSSRPSFEVSENKMIEFLFFKTLHFIEYAILFVLFYRPIKEFKKVFLLTIIYAFSDEIHQLFVPTREGKLRDVFIDASGGLFAWWLIGKVLPRLPPRASCWLEKLCLG